MISFEAFFSATRQTALAEHHTALRAALVDHYENDEHGRSEAWDAALAGMPATEVTEYTLSEGCISLTRPGSLDLDIELFTAQLKTFMPWRKGPWRILGVPIETEWRSDWKWDRLEPHISPLNGRNVLDIGTGNGYFLYRMLGNGAALAMGADPTRLFLYQFQLVQNLLPANNAHLLPLRGEHLPAFNYFDTVFSLGVLYHRRSPIDHISELLSFARDGGEIVLETLTVPGDESTILVPENRYAKMSNVWFLPSTEALENLLRRVGLENVRTVDVNITSPEEQKATDWMAFQSLTDFLDPSDHSLTVEGYPAPRRAIVIGDKPG
ncbi:MAG: tRNA 5-methoxyuridine(34)/uridine 5-oxyacetic acid(34) synthase CmoB [Gammaproteobacteria bacterium]|jgi:tRNA (mo5U34)-methyltransferase|nr:tRNA 5-methoxyuridine(34)/uridine 5-oxyacetic acid(34) synthase CmoB [Gammaproteobacteria bacterium]|tara:strand:- start:52 stop:1023 length:972 start_codon:yes stop_codon:yes gene_type:complete